MIQKYLHVSAFFVCLFGLIIKKWRWIHRWTFFSCPFLSHVSLFWLRHHFLGRLLVLISSTWWKQTFSQTPASARRLTVVRRAFCLHIHTVTYKSIYTPWMFFFFSFVMLRILSGFIVIEVEDNDMDEECLSTSAKSCRRFWKRELFDQIIPPPKTI